MNSTEISHDKLGDYFFVDFEFVDDPEEYILQYRRATQIFVDLLVDRISSILLLDNTEVKHSKVNWLKEGF